MLFLMILEVISLVYIKKLKLNHATRYFICGQRGTTRDILPQNDLQFSRGCGFFSVTFGKTGYTSS